MAKTKGPKLKRHGANTHPWQVTRWRRIKSERVGVRIHVSGVVEDADCECGAQIRRGRMIRHAPEEDA